MYEVIGEIVSRCVSLRDVLILISFWVSFSKFSSKFYQFIGQI